MSNLPKDCMVSWFHSQFLLIVLVSFVHLPCVLDVVIQPVILEGVLLESLLIPSWAIALWHLQVAVMVW